MKLDIHEVMLVRACKGWGIDRVRKVWMKQRIVSNINHYLYICRSLMEILEKIDSQKYNMEFCYSLIEDAHPNNIWKYAMTEKIESYWERFLLVLCSRIRFLEVDKIDGYIIPARFRKMVYK